MKLARIGMFAFVLTLSAGLKSQELNNVKELAKYEIERIPNDVLDIYNSENYGGTGFIPFREMQNLEKLEMHSDYAGEGKKISRSAVYDHKLNSLTMVFQGVNMGQKIEYTLNDSQLIKISYTMREGKDEGMQKMVKTADKLRRVKLIESYHKEADKWVLDNTDKRQFISYRGELVLEIKLSQNGVSDTSFYRYRDGLLSTKKNGNRTWTFSYYKNGQIALIEQSIKGYMAADTVRNYNVNYDYTSNGLPKQKFSEDEYFNTEFTYTYDKLGRLSGRTKTLHGENEVKEITGYTYDALGNLNGITQTLDGVKTLKLKVTCDAKGNIISAAGNQSKAVSKLLFKHKKGSMGSNVEGPGTIDFKLSIQARAQ